MTEEFVIYSDGAARGNPGPAAYGFVILQKGEIVAQGSERLGTTTNNVAEYQGIICGLKKALELKASSIILRSDSELLVRQITGAYRVKAAHLQGLHQEAVGLLKRFKSYQVEHVPREQNGLADALANRALDR